MEEGLVDMDCHVATIEATNGNLIKVNKELKDRIERLEIHNRKLILRVFGLKSYIEKSDPIALMTFLRCYEGS